MSRTAWVSDPFIESRQQLLTLLTEAGWHAVGVGLELDVQDIDQNKPDAIFIRQERSGTSGMAILAKVRAHISAKDVSLVLVSSEMTSEDIERHQKNSGTAEAYLKLPFDRVDVVEVLEAIQEQAFQPKETTAQPVAAGALELDISVEGVDGTLIDVYALQKSFEKPEVPLNPSAEAFVAGVLDGVEVDDIDAVDTSERETIEKLRAALKTAEEKLLKFEALWQDRESQVGAELERVEVAHENQHRAERELVALREEMKALEQQHQAALAHEGERASELHDAHLKNERLFLRTVAELESQLALEKEKQQEFRRELEGLKDQRRDQHQMLSSSLSERESKLGQVHGALERYAFDAEWAVQARDRRRMRALEQIKLSQHQVYQIRVQAERYKAESENLQYRMRRRSMDDLRDEEIRARYQQREIEGLVQQRSHLEQAVETLEEQAHHLQSVLEGVERERQAYVSRLSRQLWKRDVEYRRLREAFLLLKKDNAQQERLLQQEQAIGAAAIYEIDKRRQKDKSIAVAVVDQLGRQKHELEVLLKNTQAAHVHDVETLRGEMASLRDIATEKSNELDRSQAQVIDLTKQNKTLYKESERLQNDLAYVEEVVDGLKTEQTAHLKRLDELETECHNRARVIQGLKTELDRQVEQHAQASQQFVATRGGLENQLRAAESKSSQLEKALQKLQAERTSLEAKLKEKNRVVGEKNREISDLQNSIAAEREAIGILKQRLEQKEDKIVDLQQQLELSLDKNKRIPGLESEIERMELELQKLMDRGARLNQKISRDEESIKRLREELSDEKQASLALVHQVTTLRDSEERLQASLSGKTRAWKELQEKTHIASEQWREERTRLREALVTVLGPVERVARIVEADGDRLRDLEQHLSDMRAMIEQKPMQKISRPVRRVERSEPVQQTPFQAQHTVAEMDMIRLATADDMSIDSLSLESNMLQKPAEIMPQRTLVDIQMSDFDRLSDDVQEGRHSKKNQNSDEQEPSSQEKEKS